MLHLSPRFRRLSAPGTGRAVVQLTSGPGFAYPLYYFIPSFTADGRYLIHHLHADGEVQLRRLDLQTAESVPLTRASAPAADVHWRPWDMPAGTGVLDHRSVLNVPRDEVVYFDGNRVRVVHVRTLADRLLFSLPDDRVATGQNCVTPDGEWFVYISHDRASHARLFEGEDYTANRARSRGTELRARHLDTGEDRLLVRLNSPIHHVIPHGPDRLVFCHPANEDGMLITDLRGGWYAHLRTQDDAGAVCHFLSTARGLAYEARRHAGPGSRDYVAGLYDPATRARVEFPLPAHFGYTHTGADPEGRLWFFENHHREGGAHDLYLLHNYAADGRHEWLPLTGDWPTYGSGQKSHFHPRLAPDRRWILLVAGDPATRTNHLHLLDIADFPADSGVPAPSQTLD